MGESQSAIQSEESEENMTKENLGVVDEVNNRHGRAVAMIELLEGRAIGQDPTGEQLLGYLKGEVDAMHEAVHSLPVS